MYRVAFSWQTCVVHKSLTTSPPCPPLISVATLLYPVLPYRTLCCSTHMPYSFMTPCPWTCCSFWNYHLSCSPRQSQNVSTWSPSHSSQAKLMFHSLERPLCVCVCVWACKSTVSVRDHSGCWLIGFSHETEQARHLIHLCMRRAWHMILVLFKV